MSDPLARLRELRIVPVVVIDDAEDAIPLATALSEGGLPCVEITFRTAAAAEALRRIASEFPEMLVGAGTVLTSAQATLARESGARFIVSPGFSSRVVDHCLEHAIPVYPGVCTPTEIEMAIERDLGVVKFFPAEAAGGLKYLRAIAAPYPGLEFIPTGGLTAELLPSYLAFEPVVACGGSWMVSPQWIREGQFDLIQEATRSAVEVSAAPSGGD